MAYLYSHFPPSCLIPPSQMRPPVSAAELLSLAELVDRPVPRLPAIVDTSFTSERRVFRHYPDSVVLDEAYFDDKLLSFRRQLDADPVRYFKPVEYRGNPRPGVADSEGGLSRHFYMITGALEEVLVNKGTKSVVTCLWHGLACFSSWPEQTVLRQQS